MTAMFGQHVTFASTRPNLFQLGLPAYHEDGDPVEIYVIESPQPDHVRLTDVGITMMRLSYDFEIDSENKQRLLERTLAEGGISSASGQFFVDVLPDQLMAGALQMLQVIAKVMALRNLKRETVRRQFIEDLQNAAIESLSQLHPRFNISPIPTHEQMLADIVIDGRKPVFVFAAHNADRARLATITIQQILLESVKGVSAVVLDEDSRLPERDSNSLFTVADKIFPTLRSFKDNAAGYVKRMQE